MPTLKKICGNPNSPIPNSLVYQNDVLVGAAIDLLVVNNVIENDLVAPQAPAEYEFNAGTGEVKRINAWQLGDKLTIIYSKRCGC